MTSAIQASLAAYLVLTESKAHSLIRIASALNSFGMDLSHEQVNRFLDEVEELIDRRRLPSHRKASIVECLERFKVHQDTAGD